jgi:small subunit ribosomal protein S20
MFGPKRGQAASERQMPNSPSAKRKMRKDVVLREINRGRRSTMRTWIRKTQFSIEEGDLQTAETHFLQATKWIDKNVQWNQLHSNTASRHKSRLALALQGLRAGN